MSKWTATKISAGAANNMQIQAGLLLNRYDVTNPVEPEDEDIICTTTGNFSITCVPQTEDFFADVNNAPNNTKEGKHITGWDAGLSVGCLEITEETLILALGAAEIGSDGGVHPRSDYKQTDFKPAYWLGDMVNADNFLLVAMDNVVSTGGVSLTTVKNGKGNLALTLTAHSSASTPTVVPMAYYILEKSDDESESRVFTSVTPGSNDNPREEGWYVLSGDRYVLTTDTEVDSNKTYYELSTTT